MQVPLQMGQVNIYDIYVSPHCARCRCRACSVAACQSASVELQFCNESDQSQNLLVCHQLSRCCSACSSCCRPLSLDRFQSPVTCVLQVDVCIPAARKGVPKQLAAVLAGTVTGAAADAAVRAPLQAASRSGAHSPLCLRVAGWSASQVVCFVGGSTHLHRCFSIGSRHLPPPTKPAPQRSKQSWLSRSTLPCTRCCTAGGAVGSKYDPCVDDEVTAYLNRDDVQAALHVPLPHRPHVKYAICSNEVQYSRSVLVKHESPR